MIISKTPLRISFAGGGTDLPQFYQNEKITHGAVVSMTIDKFIYVTVNKSFNDKIKVIYSIVEEVDYVTDVKHSIVRACLQYLNIKYGVEISILSDIPGRTGLGSSSSLAVGLLNALHAYKGETNITANQLYREACEIELDILKSPIGKQDQAAAAFGGCNHFTFTNTDNLLVNPIKRYTIFGIDSHLVLLYTGNKHNANLILSKQNDNLQDNLQKYIRLTETADELARTLQTSANISVLAETLNKDWEIKKSLSTGITNPELDKIYEKALNYRALGGKLLGAGGGGFFLFYILPENKDYFIQQLGLMEVPFTYWDKGSEIIYI